MKTIELEFEPGQEVHVLVNNVPTQTRIRAYEVKGTLEVRTDAKTRVRTESINEKVLYSTQARPNDPISASKIGATKEDLIQKLFGRSGSTEAPTEAPVSDSEEQ